MTDTAEIIEMGSSKVHNAAILLPQVLESACSKPRVLRNRQKMTKKKLSCINLVREEKERRTQEVFRCRERLCKRLDNLSYPEEMMAIRTSQLGDHEFPSDKEITAAWYEAIYHRDCLEVMYLLRKWPGLLRMGWKDNPDLLVKGVPWLGRTPLHVGASRGCEELVLLAMSYSAEFGVVSINSYTTDNSVSLSSMLGQVEGSSKLEALAMALLIGNQDIVTILMEASFCCDDNPYEVREAPQIVESVCSMDSTIRRQLRSITKKILEERSDDFDGEWVTYIKHRFARVLDINFLPLEDYLFHFAFSWSGSSGTTSLIDTLPVQQREIDQLQTHIAEEVLVEARKISLEVCEFLFRVKDGCGRTAMHYAIDHGTFFELVMCFPFVTESIWSEVPHVKSVMQQSLCMNTRDAVGRSPLQYVLARARAASLRQRAFLKSLTYYNNCVLHLLRDKTTDQNACFNFSYSLANGVGQCLNMRKMMARNGFTPYHRKVLDLDEGSDIETQQQSYYVQPYSATVTALHTAIMSKNLRAVQLLLCVDEGPLSREAVDKLVASRICLSTSNPLCFTWLDLLQLAVIVGDLRILKALLQCKGLVSGLLRNKQSKDVKEREQERLIGEEGKQLAGPEDYEEDDLGSMHCKSFSQQCASSFHVAAANGDLAMIETFLACKDFDPLILTTENETALHYCVDASKATKLVSMLWDFVDASDVQSFQSAKDKFTQECESQRSRKMNNLRRQSCVNLLLQSGIEMLAKNAKDEIARPSFRAAVEFVRWWYDKVVVEIQQEQARINGAANTMSVTAALVATASYVGPVQPPSFGYKGNATQEGNIAPSFHVFLVCNTLSFYFAVASIIFSLIPSIALPQDSTLHELRRARRIVTLAVALLCPSISFLLIGIGVIPYNNDSVPSGSLTQSTPLAGASICVVAMSTFIFRLVRIACKKKKSGRKFYTRKWI